MNTQAPPSQQINSQFKKVFEDKIGDYIHNMKIVTANLPLIEFKVTNSLKTEELSTVVDQNNIQLKALFKEKYHYDFCTNFIKISIPALADAKMQQEYLSSKNEKYTELLEDIRFELGKFGAIDNIKIPLLGVDPQEEIGSVMVHFVNVASAFVCYNLLNNKPYMNEPVNIVFINSF